MIYTEYTKIKKCIVHSVGNKSEDEGFYLSEDTIELDDLTSQTLQKYLLGQVVSEGYCEFWHESQLHLNELYSFTKAIFDDDTSFVEMSSNIAKHLYACSLHPKIKSGELCVVYFKNVIIDTVTCDAIGLFKSENKDTFLKVVANGYQSEIKSDTGININKVDKAAVIFNTNAETGYWLTVVDRTNKASEAKYWTEDFLKVRPCKNSFNQTESLIAMTREFVSHMPKSAFKADKAVLINRSKEALKSSSVRLVDYSQDVFEDKKIAKEFTQYAKERSEAQGVEIEEKIMISQEATRKKAFSSLTTLKLDSNFDIKIHGGEDLMEKGYDEERGMKYYKLYFREEK